MRFSLWFIRSSDIPPDAPDELLKLRFPCIELLYLAPPCLCLVAVCPVFMYRPRRSLLPRSSLHGRAVVIVFHGPY